ncbi:hypothetical protein BCR41DRAFT_249482 [Lobosporangium transversale]|uniref:RING-type E3 ubiquitin transferase n=1 Tax=Lobosporangium transversale TaxID=64571 RepID=A0A1Y2GUJ1_9FUNG|nr:hypothetical protein BCR41DRAFT_249482 [Lobosporangium transversale]ORZ23927.1 hypothetical protein BCR41DRAFT_249482 [Lobosporangium transversale]|eukprot:XP_021883741.1 hypothetical protein BCR41DRAFT_249482 [Lobosporangium transversale]
MHCFSVVLPIPVKGYYFMGKAQLELGQPSEAYSSLKKSYELALEQRSTFTKDIVAMIAEAKKQKWIQEERKRLSETSETYRYLSGLVEKDFQQQMDALDQSASDYQDNLAYLRSDKEHRLKQLEILLQRASRPDPQAKPYVQKYLDQQQQPQESVVNGDNNSNTNNNTTPSLISPEASPQLSTKPSNMGTIDIVDDDNNDDDVKTEKTKNSDAGLTKMGSNPDQFELREVPEYMLDKITFEFMHDPVISTKSGISYERSTLLEHFSYGRLFDPVAQVPLTERDIVPNRALKEACDDFLAKNGWAVDY